MHKQSKHFWPHFRDMEIEVDLAKVVLPSDGKCRAT